MKRKIAIIAAFTALTCSSMSVSAAPVQMPDGTTFDAEYYAANNPDVVAALGVSADTLYLHYITSGKAEGRQPCAPQEITLENGMRVNISEVTNPDGKFKIVTARYDSSYKSGVRYDWIVFQVQLLEKFTTSETSCCTLYGYDSDGFKTRSKLVGIKNVGDIEETHWDFTENTVLIAINPKSTGVLGRP